MVIGKANGKMYRWGIPPREPRDIRFLAPAPGARFAEHQPVPIQIEIPGPRDFQEVRLMINGKPEISLSSPPFAASWTPPSAGSYTFQVELTYPDQAREYSSAITVGVDFPSATVVGLPATVKVGTAVTSAAGTVMTASYGEKSQYSLFYSSDGLTWGEFPPPMTGGRLLYENGITLVSTTETIYRSIDGFHWKAVDYPDDPQLQGVGVANGWFFLRSPTKHYRTRDGVTFEEIFFSQGELGESISFTGGLYFSTGINLTTTFSRDGVRWNLLPAQSGLGGNPVVWHGGKFVTVRGAELLSSADGLHWKSQALPYYLAWGTPSTFQDLLILTPPGGEAYSSRDGQNWGPLEINVLGFTKGMVSANGVLIGLTPDHQPKVIGRPLRRAPEVQLNLSLPPGPLARGDRLPYSIQARDPEGSVVRVELLAGGETVASHSGSKMSGSWPVDFIGSLKLFARAIDDEGMAGYSIPIPVEVAPVFDWQERVPGIGDNTGWKFLDWDGHYFIGAGSRGVVGISFDGASWYAYDDSLHLTSDPVDFNFSRHGGYLHFEDQTLKVTKDRLHWVQASPFGPSGETIHRIAMGPAGFLVTTEQNRAWFSADGQQWKILRELEGISAGAMDTYFQGNEYYLTSPTASSPDGVQWTPRPQTRWRVPSTRVAGKHWIIKPGQLSFSHDGRSFAVIPMDSMVQLRTVGKWGRTWLVFGTRLITNPENPYDHYRPYAAISNDLDQWTPVDIPFARRITAAAGGQDSLVVALDNFFIYQTGLRMRPLTSTQVEAMLHFMEVSPLEEGWAQTELFGPLYIDRFPWLFHPHWGWIYAAGEGVNGFSFYLPKAGWNWLWTSPSNFPWVWSYAHNRWVYFHFSPDSTATWYWDPQVSAWAEY